MKQQDIAIIIGIVMASCILSFVISSKVISTPSDRQQQVQVIPEISSRFNTPSSTYFNSSAIDPTQLLQIGNNSNAAPFNSSTNQ